MGKNASEHRIGPKTKIKQIVTPSFDFRVKAWVSSILFGSYTVHKLPYKYMHYGRKIATLSAFSVKTTTLRATFENGNR